MKNIQVKVLNEGHENPAGMMMFLARLTQRSHSIGSMEELLETYYKSMDNHKIAKTVAKLPHGTIKRFSPITIAITGASRRFLTQIRTHHVGIDFVSGSLQYSDYGNTGQFVIPFEILASPEIVQKTYLTKCYADLAAYNKVVEIGLSNDTAGYLMNQALRNVLVIQGNHEAWANLIRFRSCHRNTPETQYVALLIWEALLETTDGQELFHWLGPDCLHSKCREGAMSCGEPFKDSTPRDIINTKWGNLL